jgi:hypothetical protein
MSETSRDFSFVNSYLMHRRSFFTDSESTILGTSSETADFASEAVVCAASAAALASSAAALAASADAFAAPFSSRSSEIMDGSLRSSDSGERFAGHENYASRQNKKTTQRSDEGTGQVKECDGGTVPPFNW